MSDSFEGIYFHQLDVQDGPRLAAYLTRSRVDGEPLSAVAFWWPQAVPIPRRGEGWPSFVVGLATGLIVSGAKHLSETGRTRVPVPIPTNGKQVLRDRIVDRFYDHGLDRPCAVILRAKSGELHGFLFSHGPEPTDAEMGLWRLLTSMFADVFPGQRPVNPEKCTIRASNGTGPTPAEA